MAENNLKSAIEALLLASEKPLSLEQLKYVLDLDVALLRRILGELKSDYEQRGSGIRITEIAGGFQMTTATDYAPFLRKLFKGRHVERLSKPALETLAIIAYKQPLTKQEIEFLRDVNVDGVMKSLVDKNLIRITGRKKAPGRPFVFGTTRQFLEHFGLNSLDELPKIENFQAMAEKAEDAVPAVGQEQNQAGNHEQSLAEELNGAKESA